MKTALTLLLICCALPAQTRYTSGSFYGRVDAAKPPNLGQRWTNRNPIAQLFISDENDRTATNPGGYLGSDWGNPSDIDMFDHDDMMAAFTAAANQVVAVLDAQAVTPQGVIIWDAEGAEFQPYLGNPSLIHVIAPYIEDGLDELIDIIHTAGYDVGFTLRSPIPYGTTLPATCEHHATLSQHSDRFLDYDELYSTGPGDLSRGFFCNETDVWIPLYSINREMASVNQGAQYALREINYTRKRWNAKFFYWDSNVVAGSTITGGVHEFLMRASPNILLIPEHQFLTHSYYKYTAPLLSCAGTDEIAKTPDDVRAADPSHFSAINCGTSSGDTESFFDEIVEGVAGGDFTIIKARYSGVTTNVMLSDAYEEANTPWDGETPASPIASDLARWYKFDDGTGDVLTDSTVNAQHGQLGSTSGSDTNDPTWATEGLSFDGSDDYVTIPAFTAGEMTIIIAAQRTIASSTGALVGTNAAHSIKLTSSAAQVVAGDSSVNSVSEPISDDGSWRIYTARYEQGVLLGIVEDCFAGQEYDMSLADAAFSVSVFGSQGTASVRLTGMIGYALMYSRYINRAETKANYMFIREELSGRGVTLPACGS